MGPPHERTLLPRSYISLPPFRGQRFTANREKMYRGRGYLYSHNLDVQKCGKCCRGHGQEENCAARGKTCRKCHKKGHFERMYNSVQEVKADLQDVGTDEEREFFLDAVITDNTKPWTTKLNIQGTDVQFKINTGTDVTIINERTHEQLNKPKLLKSKIVLSSPGGRPTTKGEFFAEAVVKDKAFRFRVIVIKNRVR